MNGDEREELVKVKLQLEENNRMTREMYNIIIGDGGHSGLKTRMSLVEQSLKKLWWVWGAMFLVLAGGLCKVLFIG